MTFNSTSRDLGVYLQMLWNGAHGQPFQTTILESNRVHLAEHVALLLTVLAPAFALAPDANWLFVAQSAVLALAGVPVYLLARQRLGGMLLPTLVMAAYFAMPMLTEVAFDAIYPITWTALPLGFSAYFLLSGRLRAGVALAVVALPMEEEAGLMVVGLGLFLLLQPGSRRVGVGLAGTALLWLALVALVVMPRFHEPSTLPSGGENRTVAHFEALRDKPGAILGDLFGARLPLLGRWLVAPTGGVALLAPQAVLIDLPHAATLLLADKEGRYRRHWGGPTIPIIWLATVVGLARLRRPPLRAMGVGLMLIGTVATYVLDSNLPGGGDYDPADAVWTDRSEQFRYVVDRVPPGVSVAASRRALGHLADHSELYVYPPNYAGALWPPERHIGAYVLDLTNGQTADALRTRQSPLRARPPYVAWSVGPDALLLTEQAPAPAAAIDRELAGVVLHGAEVRRGRSGLEVTLQWRAGARTPGSMTRVVRVFGADGTLLVEARGLALDDFMPSGDWPPGQIVVDRVTLPFAGAGPVALEVGWADRNGRLDVVRLAVDGDMVAVDR
ncbi:MAG: DUF2079 domain-containing protein [Chloroflexi bacterium]|nr:DUF2079 domain-containing protein [Chloroflexota bacterium]